MYKRMLVVGVLIFGWVLSGMSAQQTSCLDGFREFEVVDIAEASVIGSTTYSAKTAWYGNCILVGIGNGIWLFDPHQPTNPMQLAQGVDHSITALAVNPVDLTIAFSAEQEPAIHLIDSNGELSTRAVSGDEITAISFSDDGRLMAVSSSEVYEYESAAFYDKARVQIWYSDGNLENTLISDVAMIVGVFISSDGKYAVTHGRNPGYIGDHVNYWDLDTELPVWNRDNLLGGLETWSVNDPLAISFVAANDYLVALGGLHGFRDWDDYMGTGVHIWDADTQSRLIEIVIHSRGKASDDDYLTGMVFNPFDDVLATVQNNGVVRLWNPLDGSLIDETNVSLEAAYQLAYSADGAMLSVINNEQLIVLDAETLEEIASIDLVVVPSAGE